MYPAIFGETAGCDSAQTYVLQTIIPSTSVTLPVDWPINSSDTDDARSRTSYAEERQDARQCGGVIESEESQNTLLLGLRQRKANKLDPQTKVNVDFKPPKKMKKRRELDALVNGKLGRRKPQKKGEHELLRNDTDSSDVEEFAIPPKAIVRKRSSAARFCSTCIAVCGFFLLVACILAIGGLVWVHIELKKDVDDLRAQLHTVGAQTYNPEEFQQYSKKQTDLEEKMHEMQDEESSLTDKQDNIMKLIGTLNSTVTRLSKGLDAAPQLQSLPKTVNDLSQQVATLGSDIGTLQEDLSELKSFRADISSRVDQLHTKVEYLDSQSAGGREGPVTAIPAVSEAQNEALQTAINQLQHDLSDLDSRLSSKITDLQEISERHRGELSDLHNSTTRLETRISILELHPSTDMTIDTSNMEALVQSAVEQAMQEIQNPTEADGITLQMLNNEITNITNEIYNLKVKVAQQSAGSGMDFSADITQIRADLDALRADVYNKFMIVNDTLSVDSQNLVTLEGTVHHQGDLIDTLQSQVTSQLLQSQPGETEPDQTPAPHVITASTPPPAGSMTGQDAADIAAASIDENVTNPPNGADKADEEGENMDDDDVRDLLKSLGPNHTTDSSTSPQEP